MVVAEHLDLDVPRAADRLLDDQLIGPKRRAGFAACGRKRRRQIFDARHQPHAAPATARCRLDHHRQTDAPDLVSKRRIGLIGTLIAGNARDARSQHQPLGRSLVAHGANGVGSWTNEDKVGRDTGRREISILR